MHTFAPLWQPLLVLEALVRHGTSRVFLFEGIVIEESFAACVDFSQEKNPQVIHNKKLTLAKWPLRHCRAGVTNPCCRGIVSEALFENHLPCFAACRLSSTKTISSQIKTPHKLWWGVPVWGTLVSYTQPHFSGQLHAYDWRRLLPIESSNVLHVCL